MKLCVYAGAVKCLYTTGLLKSVNEFWSKIMLIAEPYDLWYKTGNFTIEQ